MTEHTAKYFFDRLNPRLWKCECTCGAWHIECGDDSLAKLETWFSGHDIGGWIEHKDVPEWKRRLEEIKHR